MAASGATPSLWTSPNATFFHTGRESKRAPPWNSTPNFLITRSRSGPSMSVVSSPSMTTEPESGRIRPRMHLSRTDFPEPEAPITTSDSPMAMSRSTPHSTCLLPNDLAIPRRDILGAPIAGERTGTVVFKAVVPRLKSPVATCPNRRATQELGRDGSWNVDPRSTADTLRRIPCWRRRVEPQTANVCGAAVSVPGRQTVVETGIAARSVLRANAP